VAVASADPKEGACLAETAVAALSVRPNVIRTDTSETKPWHSL